MRITFRNPTAAMCLLASYSALVFGSSYRPSSSQQKPVINTTNWIQVQLPFRPVALTAVGNSIWVCGTNEMIAVSSDGGASWDMRHQSPNGEVLLNIAFVNASVGHAAGTNGLLLATSDGGKTWSSHDAAATINKFSFSDSLVGIADVGGVVELTKDGGDSWQGVATMQTDEKVRPFSEIESLAALDSNHLAIALHQPQGEEIFLSTGDGGKTWIPTHVVNTFAGMILIHDGKFWAFGIEYLGREHNPNGGYSAPVALYSSDARTWEHGARATNEFSGCTVQGCFYPYGVIEELYGPAVKIWSLPQNSPTAPQWAIAGDRVCTIEGGLKCGSAITSDAPQPPPSNASSEMFQAQANQPLLQGCLDCGFQMFKPDPMLAHRAFALSGVKADINVNRDGTVEKVSISGLPGTVLAEELSAQISRWLITPAHNGTETAKSKRSMEFGVVCFPAFPGQPGDGTCTAHPAKSSAGSQPSVSVQ